VFGPPFFSFPGTHAFQGNELGLVYRHASTTWDELSPKEGERAMGFETCIISHTKVIRLKCNTLLRRCMDLNSLTWLLVTYVFIQMYTDLISLQFWRCEYMAPRPNTLAYLQHFALHS
jgi:hypothetical protein